MNWCCLTFKNWYEAAGLRGLTVLVGRTSSGEPEFVIQQRAIDMEIDVRSFPAVDYPISIVSDVGINFCPWCGRNLKKCYGKYIEQLYRPGLRVTES